jgi:hypothetical protein
MPPDVDRQLTGELCATTGKVRHSTEATAAHVARQMQLRDDRTLEVYRCSSCRDWHVGHATP